MSATYSPGDAELRSNPEPGSWTSLDLHLELDGARGRTRAVEHALREAILGGRLAAGEPLPSSRALAADLGLARGTVVEAYGQLVAEGLLIARRGMGTTIAPRPPGSPGPQPRRPATPVADFTVGSPDLGGFPTAAWGRAVRAVLHRGAREFGMLDPQGALRLRRALTGYLGRARGVHTDAERVVVCSGFVQGLRLVCEVAADRGARRVALEDPCMPHYRDIVARVGLVPTALPVDEDGARLPPSGSEGPDVVVLTPAHQFPLGVRLTAARRAGFRRWARETGALIVEDDYDAEFFHDGASIPTLQADAPEHVIYAGSASKILAPGLRLGWLAVPDRLVEAFVVAKRRADWGSSMPDQLALAEMIESAALDRHVRRARSECRSRCDALLAMLADRPGRATAVGVAAGMHAVLALPPDSPGEAALAATAAARTLVVDVLGRYYAGCPPFPALVVGYATPPAHGYAAALRELAALLDTR